MNPNPAVHRLFTVPRVFIAVLIIEVCILYLLRWPLLYNFNSFAFWDSGSYLVAHYLLQQGHRPFTYFGWQYGLLPLFIQELGFHLFGASPASFLCLSMPCVMTVAAVMGRFALLESGAAGCLLVMLSLPLMLAFQPDMPHSLEPALLSLGLLSQAKAQHARALAFAAAACFTKPSMGYLYGLVLLFFIFRSCSASLLYERVQGCAPQRRKVPIVAKECRTQDYCSGLRAGRCAHALVPAVCTGLFLAILLSIIFGWATVLHSLLPFSGARAYRALHFGWRRIAQGFFYFPGVKPAYYIGTPAGFWACGTIYLVAAALATVWSDVRNRHGATNSAGIVLSCAVLHIGFIAFFYGDPSSWQYYAYVLVAGVVATRLWSCSTAAISVLCLLAALGNYTGIKAALSAWRTMERSTITAGLFAPPAEQAEWRHVASLVEFNNPDLLANFGEAEILCPWLVRPTAAFIIPGVATDAEIRRETHQLRSAGAVIIPTVPGVGSALEGWPGAEFSDVLEGAALIFKGTYFEVHKRRAAY